MHGLESDLFIHINSNEEIKLPGEMRSLYIVVKGFIADLPINIETILSSQNQIPGEMRILYNVYSKSFHHFQC